MDVDPVSVSHEASVANPTSETQILVSVIQNLMRQLEEWKRELEQCKAASREEHRLRMSDQEFYQAREDSYGLNLAQLERSLHEKELEKKDFEKEIVDERLKHKHAQCEERLQHEREVHALRLQLQQCQQSLAARNIQSDNQQSTPTSQTPVTAPTPSSKDGSRSGILRSAQNQSATPSQPSAKRVRFASPLSDGAIQSPRSGSSLALKRHRPIVQPDEDDERVRQVRHWLKDPKPYSINTPSDALLERYEEQVRQAQKSVEVNQASHPADALQFRVSTEPPTRLYNGSTHKPHAVQILPFFGLPSFGTG
ncbi:hypothetical protein H2203_006913 [Taxawa tesnikishii (nom. ined.)]|nr:hypothetical protein H2203_006913 [Dothideales sp. JES 119]